MYELSDERAAITEVQKFLHVISDDTNGKIPRVAIDGIYGAETRDAVRIFQLEYNLNSTGEVDKETFDLLYALYIASIEEREFSDYIITDEGFPLKVGMQNNDVLLLHLLIEELSKTYSDIDPVKKTTYFSESTENAVKNLQRIFRTTENGEVDFLLYQRITYELDAIRRINEKYD